MKKSLLILSILFLLNACSFENSKDTGKVGEKSAEISAKDTLGKAVKLADDNTSLKV
ncbi:TPA: TlpA family protein disulfide reductase, partial [Campylobacter jejuni]|nr:TlpA family protein disulfide reductase [Campylobacter jejuni]HEC2646613.1 TlpA family protein disulfide reductase [Campylobacter jejuni]HEC2688611.1 TlpA family protein disulfide reductase [Campylobacter jejuni]HEC2747951.1 TlpA family protein disulfide reductase [Campylobacter jejuni]